MGATATLIVAVAAVLIAPLVGYITATRKLSGKIGTSDAGKLWEAAEQMRSEYREQLGRANERLVSLEIRLATVEADNHTLANENLLLQRQVDLLRRENKRLQQKIDDLEQELHEAKGTA